MKRTSDGFGLQVPTNRGNLVDRIAARTNYINELQRAAFPAETASGSFSTNRCSTTDSGHLFASLKSLRDPAIASVDFYSSSTANYVGDMWNEVSGCWNASSYSFGFATQTSSLTTASERQGVANNFFANTNPDRNEASMGVTMIELLRGDIPSVLKNFRKMTEEAQSLRKTLGSDYLNIAFGWAPLISEAANLLKIGLSIDRAIYYESFRRQRQWDGPSVRTNAVVSGVSLGYTRSPVGTFNYGGSSVSAPYSSGNGISLSNIERVTVRQEDYSFTSRYTGIAKPPSLANYHMERALNMAQRLGVINDPQLIWELMPYSWLVDWFSTMGSSISNANTYSPMKGKYSVDYAYVTTKHVVEETLDFTTGKFNNPTLLRSFAWRNPVSYGATTCKWRDRATPFGFGTQLGSLSASQFGILVALGLAKSR
jgi:hypothetical protein